VCIGLVEFWPLSGGGLVLPVLSVMFAQAIAGLLWQAVNPFPARKAGRLVVDVCRAIRALWHSLPYFKA
jgi:hypothetical protein